MFWRAEDGGTGPDNIEAWCIECFANNFDVPRETVALLALDLVDYARLLEEHRRRAITLKSVLRDAAERSAGAHSGRIVFDRLDDDVLLEFPTSGAAVDAVRDLGPRFRELAGQLDLDAPQIRGAIHFGKVTRWRSGLLVGEAVEVTMNIRRVAGSNQVLLTEPAASPLTGKVELVPLGNELGDELLPVGGIWGFAL